MKMVLLLMMLPMVATSQIANDNALMKSASGDSLFLKKWIAATINIECRLNIISKDLEWSRSGANPYYEANRLKALFALPSSYGTAIYLKVKNHHFLVTARHVLWDTCFHADSNRIAEKIYLVDKAVQKSSEEIGNGYLINDLRDLNLNRSYVYSSPKEDLAIIDLDKHSYGINVISYLEKHGYRPLSIEDIDATWTKNDNMPIYCIGFPVESFANKQIEDYHQLMIESKSATIPFVTHGTVAASLKDNPYFLGDIFIYHGFSGGPVINKKTKKMIGVTSQLVPVVVDGPMPYVNFSMGFIKSTLILRLLKTMDSK